MPGTGWPEGAVKLLDCSVALVCDADGSCEAGSELVTFRMEPLETEVGGAGRYTIRYADVETAMEAVSDIGPFFWTVGGERDTLVASGETKWLWHRLTVDGGPEAAIRFLTCSFQP